MIARKNIDHIALIVIAAAVLFCVVLMLLAPRLAEKSSGGVRMEYEEKLFDTSSPLRVEIEIDEDDWASMLASPMSDTYYSCDVTLAGKTFREVGIKPKGSTSLAFLAGSDSDRYSLKLEFDHFIGDQTCFGLDKLALNNNYGDPSNMREALAYDMFAFLGADASLYNFAEIYINGEYWGAFTALEFVEDSYLLRHFGTEQGGQLYKPELNGGGGANLNYSDDSLDSYNAIWAAAKTEGATDADHRRVVTALQHISEGTELETYLDVDNVLRYMAVHNFVVNDDSLSGGMTHNYFLYERDGQLNILPWDYNLTFGTMMGSSDNATTIVNTTIDDHWRGTSFFNALLDNEEYRARYHEYYRQLTEAYIFGGGFAAFYENACAVTEPLVKNDPTALFTFDEYLAARDTLRRLVLLRGASVWKQLEGDIPATTAGRGGSVSGEFPWASQEVTEDTDEVPEFTLVDASDIDMSVMGGVGGGFGGGPFGGGGPFSRRSEVSAEASDAASSEASDAASDKASDAASTETSEASSGEASREFSPPDFSGEFPSGEMRRGLDAKTIRTQVAWSLVLLAGIAFAAWFKRRL